MDKLLSVGKDMLQQQLSGQGQSQVKQLVQAVAVHLSQAEATNSHQDQGGGGGNSSSGGGFQDDILRMAQQHASSNAGHSGNSDLFSNIMSAVGNKQEKIQNEDIDEQDAIKQHQHAYNNDGKGDSSSLGTAAAMQALKKFTQSDNNASSGTGQAAFLGMAMSEASKLFDSKASQGKVADGASKENVVQQAAEMAMKMYFKSQAESQGGLAGLASKFIK
ncbi:beta-flanking protein [Metarhizium acridum CQMa 102]|uniref:Beta-flanking protein n=1 Tax=Metarhizium acridum (strain CQMa 102) TaxID=655827 RepID=E9EI47_METAQ|nr:beta-flanking protein [Metarhizium acridum CQMa 102]EFY84418.1 beta-flanking protein [Metarhizium acridum CQMa 102]